MRVSIPNVLLKDLLEYKKLHRELLGIDLSMSSPYSNVEKAQELRKKVDGLQIAITESLIESIRRASPRGKLQQLEL